MELGLDWLQANIKFNVLIVLTLKKAVSNIHLIDITNYL